MRGVSNGKEIIAVYKNDLKVLCDSLLSVIPPSNDMTYVFSETGGLFTFNCLTVGFYISMVVGEDGNLHIVDVGDGAVRISNKQPSFYNDIEKAFTRFLKSIQGKCPIIDSVCFRLPMKIGRGFVEAKSDGSVVINVCG